MEDLSAGSPHVTGHFDQLLLQRVCVLGQLVQAKGPVSSLRVQLDLQRLLEDEAERSASSLVYATRLFSYLTDTILQTI